MDDHNTLLERMASISPGVRLHLEGKLWLQHIDEDEVDSQQLVNECFSVIVSEAYEIGIEFHCTLNDLCESFYHLDQVLLLFEVVFPTPLYRNITEDASFKTFLTTVVVDGVSNEGESSIMTILHYLAYDHPSLTDEEETTQNIFQDSCLFLEDKLRSTPAFDTYVKSILDVDNTPFDVPVDVETLGQYITHVNSRVARLLKAIDTIKTNTIIDVSLIAMQYNRVIIYRNNAIEPTAMPRYAWAYQLTQSPIQTSTEQALLIKINQEFDSITPFYEEYFRIQIPSRWISPDSTHIGMTDFLTQDVISLILGCFDESTTLEAFTSAVDAVFHRFITRGMIMSNEMYALVHRITMSLTQEFTP